MSAAPLSTAERLSCLRCGAAWPMDLTAYLCPDCGAGDGDPGILDVHYDLERAAVELALVRSRPGLGKWEPLLPVALPEGLPRAGDTPLVEAPRLAALAGVGRVFLKDETRNPTQCLKDRATTVAIAVAERLGLPTVVCASAGNAAVSLAAFARERGLRAHAFVGSGTSAERKQALADRGAVLHVVDGTYDDAFDAAEEFWPAAGAYSRNCAFNPFLVEGKKTVGLEIAAQLGAAPDVVVAPVGDGCTLAAAGKGFREATAVGLTRSCPRLVGVQAEAVQPLVREHRGLPAVAPGPTAAASIDVHRPRNRRRLLAEIERSGGDMLAVTDEEMARAQKLLERDGGIEAELTSAASLAGLLRLAEAGASADATAVLLVTGGRRR